LYTETLINQQGEKHMSDLMTISEVAQLLRVDGTTVRRWVQQGALEAIVLPHMNKRQAYRIKRETVSKILGEGVQQQ
jgi:excisionase family DNA binding protein